MFEQHMSLYLSSETSWNRELLSSICTEWDRKLLLANNSDKSIDPTFLTAQNPQLVKKNVLANFGKALLLPVTIVPKTVVFGVNAITYGGTMAFNVMSGGLIGGGKGGTTQVLSPVNGFTAIDPDNLDNLITTRPERQRTTSSSSLPTTPSSTTTKSGTLDVTGFQMLLSIETAMQLIQADRDCLKRIQTFEGYSKWLL